MSVLLIEQRATEALEASQRCYVLEQGRVIMGGAASQLLNNDEIKRSYLGMAAA
jgi:branched-chain amino acid transport system ATP-binding protein